MSNTKKTEILLESGTNELEVMEFTIADRHFGINVAKVEEIMKTQPITPMPNSTPFVEGVFKPRDKIMTVVNLAAYMGLPPSDNEERDIFIITNFNKISTAFHVHNVVAIYRISWTDIEKPDPTIYGGDEGLATGIARYDNRLITIIDFEKILVDISPEVGIQMKDIDNLGPRTRNTHPILVAEDSPLLEKMIVEALEKSGYSNIIACANGAEAWDKLSVMKANGRPIDEQISCIITDIEMPQMDGHFLTRKIRNDEKLGHVPVIIFSSLINDEMKKKGKSVGASAQLSKPEIGNLVETIDKFVIS